MYGVSNAYKTQVKAPTREWAIKLSLTLDSGVTYNLTEKDIETSTFTFQESATCGSTIQVGSVYANSLDFSLINSDGKYNNDNFQDATVSAQVGLKLPDGTYEWVPLGTFYVSSTGKKLSTLAINCMDGMYKLNVPFADVDIQYPINAAALVTAVCNHCNVPISSQLTQELLQIDVTLSKLDSGDLTCRDILGYAGCLLGKNLRFNRSGLLEPFWYGSSAVATTSADTRISGEFEDLQINITGVSLKDSVGTEYWQGSSTLVAQLDANPLIQNAEVAQETLVRIYNSITGVSYRPYSVQHMGDPSIQAGDRIMHYRASENIESVVMTNIFKFHGSATLSAVGTSAEQSRQTTSATKQVQQVAAQAKVDLNQGLKTAESVMAMQSSLITQALGFYPHIEYNEDGSFKALYLMSTPNDTPNTLVWAVTLGGIGVSHTGIAGPYTSSWTMNDSIQANTMTANMISTGILQSADGTAFYLDLDNGVLRMDASSIALNGKQLGDFIQVTYDELGRPVLSLGWSGNNIQLKLLNDRISFVDADDKELAYWTTNSFRLKTLQSFQLGNMKMVAQENGSVSFIKGDS